MRDLSPRTLASSKRTRVTPARLHCVIGTVTLDREGQRTDRLAARVANVAASHAKGEMTSEPTRQRLRVATYNVHGCVGMDAQRSEDRIAEVIASMSADIVGLQELDLGRPRSAHADQAALIAKQLGWKHYFHPAMRHGDGQYGNAILSRFPIELQRAAELPGPAPWYCR